MTKRQKRIKYMIEYHPDVLQHFLEESGHPIHSEFDMFSDNSWLCCNREGLLARDKSQPIPDDLLAAWWKFRFDEVSGDYHKLSSAVDKLRNL